MLHSPHHTELPRLRRQRDAEPKLSAAFHTRQQMLVALDRQPPAEHPNEEDRRVNERRTLREERDLIERGPGDAWQRAELRPIVVAAGIFPPPGSVDPCDDLGGLIRIRRTIRQIEDELRAAGIDPATVV